MSLRGTTSDNSGFVGRDATVEVAEEDLVADFEEDVVLPVAAATPATNDPYPDTQNYRGAAATADKLVEPKETAKHAWKVAGAAQEGRSSRARVTDAEWTTSDNSWFVGRDGTVEVAEEDLVADFEEDVVPPAAAATPATDDPYPDTPNYRGAAAAADKLVEP
ncbi:unnamed protein product [Closterium sp. NIES-65]|nr:unnamed protein product [Closterium sp. NIES-65]